MAEPDQGASREISVILERIDQGEQQAAEELLPMVYTELRRQARVMIAREKPGQTLQPTALVHEAYIRAVGSAQLAWDGRGHFYAAAAESMRRILIDTARNKRRIKRGGEFQRAEMDDIDIPFESHNEDVLEVQDALEALEAADPRARQIVNMRYFAGFTTKETAQTLGLSVTTIEREWRFIRAWLDTALSKGESKRSQEK